MSFEKTRLDRFRKNIISQSIIKRNNKKYMSKVDCLELSQCHVKLAQLRKNKDWSKLDLRQIELYQLSIIKLISHIELLSLNALFKFLVTLSILVSNCVIWEIVLQILLNYYLNSVTESALKNIVNLEPIKTALSNLTGFKIITERIVAN